MLKTEIKKLHDVREKVLSLGRDVVEVNQLILHYLEGADIDELSGVQQESRRSMQKRADEIDNDVVTILSLYCPEARDLRELISYLKISNEIIRAYTNSCSFIKSFAGAFSSDLKEQKILDYVIPMQQNTVSALSSALAMIKMESEDEIKKTFSQVYVEENQTDKLYELSEADMIKLSHKNTAFTLDYLEILKSIRRIEKVADRALSLASLVYYAKLGGGISQDIEVSCNI